MTKEEKLQQLRDLKCLYPDLPMEMSKDVKNKLVSVINEDGYFKVHSATVGMYGGYQYIYAIPTSKVYGYAVRIFDGENYVLVLEKRGLLDK